ncbi:hypothetical protein EST38_g7798 [Candolleomyces aberdarensis]|uniref:Nephrocystin 3-like N-terminal domain-containing protein n=1 Tax=Candolleomyces aberdarensis TaxID=2316362 RepID=A0A4Q2DH14_9AGAR|nr:hypothetical protein EST38_g7798 [Candolleomyces aberdarensis]
MTGAAGAGKSALQQTIAERCAKSGILAATFCFSSTDPTRNRASTVVATIAYQLGLKHPLFQSSIVAAVKRDPLIFSQSLRSQMEGLIVQPFESLRRTNQLDIDTFPCAILIDGLDECKGEPNDTVDPTLLEVEERRQAEDRQAELLSAIWHCILNNGLPLRVFIASRPEWAIRTALAPGGQLHQVAYHIQLSDKYDATGDMCRYLRRRFEDIGLRIGNSHWFTEDNINALVEAASGQFVYVATVFQYISERRASPAERLRIVLTWTPHIGQVARPFKALDELYTNILLAAKNAYEAVDTHHGRDFLLLFRAHEINVTGFTSGSSLPLRFPADVLSVLLGLEAGAEESLVSDLHSLVALEKEKDVPHTWEELPLPESHKRWLMGAARTLPFFFAQALGIDDEVIDFTQKDCHTLEIEIHRDQRKIGWVISGPTSFFQGASAVQMRDIQYFETSHLTVNTGGSGEGERSVDGWELLLKHTAPNALYNSSVRYDAPKCDEDTRVEVTSEIMGWIVDRDGPQPLLCMTGAAGSGKSALQQTIAVKCENHDILAASFIFSATDPSRNTINAVIPTIAYQLGRRNPILKKQIKRAVEEEPLIFSQTLQAQLFGLILKPLEGMKMNLSCLPHAILIDGLDECTGEDRQAELLTAIEVCLLAKGLPFRILVASRPEWAIRTALEPGGHLHKMAYHIQLSDKYDASADMRRYLRRRFEDIGVRVGDPQWFTQDDIDTFVRAASGQFIYVATVSKYISERRGSPTERLKTVLTWAPHEGQMARPFKALDTLYTNILTAAKNAYEAVDTHYGRDFLLLVRVHHLNSAGLSGVRGEENLFSDLRSLMTLEKDYQEDLQLRLYHKSFFDFLEEESRAKDLFVPCSRVHTHLAKCAMERITECPLDFSSLPDKWEELPLPKPQRDCLREAIKSLPPFLCKAAASLDDDEVVDFTQKGGWPKLDKLLPLVYRTRSSPNMRAFWINYLHTLTLSLNPRHPEVAVVIKKASRIRNGRPWHPAVNPSADLKPVNQ